MSPDGNDTNPGTLGKPFKTIEAARDAVREMKNDDKLKSVTIYIRGGTYILTEPLVLNRGMILMRDYISRLLIWIFIVEACL